MKRKLENLITQQGGKASNNKKEAMITQEAVCTHQVCNPNLCRYRFCRHLIFLAEKEKREIRVLKMEMYSEGRGSKVDCRNGRRAPLRILSIIHNSTSECELNRLRNRRRRKPFCT